MRKFFITIAYNAIRAYIGSGAFKRIENMVDVMSKADKTGAEKRAYVLDWAKKELMEIRTGLVRVVIELVLMKK